MTRDASTRPVGSTTPSRTRMPRCCPTRVTKRRSISAWSITSSPTCPTRTCPCSTRDAAPADAALPVAHGVSPGRYRPVAEMIGHARASNPGIPLVTGDLRALPHADASMRAVLCWYAVIHSSKTDVAVIVREVGRVLMPGGTVLFGFQAGTGERIVERAYGHDVTLHGVLHQTREFAHWLDDAGFDVTATADRAPVGVRTQQPGIRPRATPLTRRSLGPRSDSARPQRAVLGGSGVRRPRPAAAPPGPCAARPGGARGRCGSRAGSTGAPASAAGS